MLGPHFIRCHPHKPHIARNSNFRSGLRKCMYFEKSAKWPFKVIEGHWFRSQPKERNFLLVIKSILDPTLPRFRDIAGFLLRRATPPLFHPNFGFWLPMLWLRGAKSGVINFKLVQPICPLYLNVGECRRTLNRNEQLLHPAVSLR